MRQGLTVPTLYPSRCTSCGSSYLESSRKAGAILSPHLPDTRPRDWHTASPTGGSLCGNCSYSATCFPRPQPPPVPAHPARPGWRRGGRGRAGHQPAVQGHSDPLGTWTLHIQGLHQERVPFSLLALSGAPLTWGAGYRLQSGVHTQL